MAKIHRILNYSGSPVAFRTREKGYLVPGGTIEEPSVILLDENEIVEANYASRVFKDGLLFPEADEAEEVYTLLRIQDWKNIPRDGEIEQIILHPTADGLRKLIAIDTVRGFERVWGILTMLRISFQDVPNQAYLTLNARHEELKKGIHKTEIAVSDMPKDIENASEELKAENAGLKDENAKLREELERLRAATASTSTSTEPAEPKKTVSKVRQESTKKVKE